MKWEYKTIEISAANVFKFNEKVNDLGSERWELVSCIGFTITAMLAIFKRPIENDPDEGWEHK